MYRKIYMYEQCYEFYNRKTNAFEITSNKAYFLELLIV